MDKNRMGLAAALTGAKAPQQGEPVVESQEHEAQEESVIGEILGTVKDIQQKLDALMGAEQAEQRPAMPVQQPPAGNPGA